MTTKCSHTPKCETTCRNAPSARAQRGSLTRPRAVTAFLLTSTLALTGLLALAHSSKAAPGKIYNISNAAGVYVTSRGQEYFQSQLVGLLQHHGVNLTQRLLPEWQYESPNEISLKSLAERFQPYTPALNYLRDNLSDWLTGFNLHNPRFAVQVRNAGYDAQGLKLSLHPDWELTQSLQGAGIVMMLEAEFPSIRIHADKVRARDLNNSFLGNFGLNRPWIELRDHTPLKVSVPVRIQVMPGGGIQLETLPVSTNVHELKFASGHDHPIVLPKVQLQINQRISTLDTRPIEKAVVAKEAELIRIFQLHLKDFIEQELPTRLNDMAFDKLQADFENVKQIDPPGADPFKNGSKFDWGMRLADLSLTPNFLQLSLEGYVTDPEVTWNENLKRTHRNPPTLKGQGADSYDFAMAINLDVINRILFLGHQRGSFDRVECSDGQTIKLVSPPVLSGFENGQGKLHLVIERQNAGFKTDWQQYAGLASSFQVSFDAIVKLGLAHKGTGFDMYIDHIDESSAHIRDEDLTLQMFRSKVDEKVRAEVRATNARFANAVELLTSKGPIEVPSDLFGFPVRIKAVEFDENGYFDLFMEYGDRQK
jgi:hypothetical protein